MKTFIGLCVVLACLQSMISVCYGYYVNGSDDIQRQLHQQITKHYLSNFQVAGVSRFPYHVIIVDSSKAMTNPYTKPRIVCQGALINNIWIITSASCVWSNYGNLYSETTLAVIGTNDYLENYHESANTRKLSYYVFHPQFNTQTGKGNDVALWKLNTPIMDTGYHRVIELVDQPRLPILSNCEYTTNIDHTLYGNNARLMTLEPCEIFGVPDGIGYCVVMNNTLHENTKHLETGCPLVCGNKLYALRNFDGNFTTAFSSKPWVVRVINETQNHDVNVTIMESTFKRKTAMTLRTPVARNPRVIPVSSKKSDEEEPHMPQNYYRPKNSSAAGADHYPNPDESDNYNLIYHTEFRRLRLRRAIGSGDIDLMFQSWSKSVSKMDPKRQLRIKIAISKIVTEGELEDIYEKEYLEEEKKEAQMERKEEAKMRAEYKKMKKNFKEEEKREYLRSHYDSYIDLFANNFFFLNKYKITNV